MSQPQPTGGQEPPEEKAPRLARAEDAPQLEESTEEEDGGESTEEEDGPPRPEKPAGPAPPAEPAPPAAGTPRPEPAERPAHYYVVSDSSGFVGAFYSEAAARAETDKYHLVPFITQRFGVAPGPTATVWVVLYRDIDAVAFVTNSRAEAVKVQEMFASVGLAYTDPIDCWEQPANAVTEGTAARLGALSRAHTMYVGPAALEALQEKDLATIARLVAPPGGAAESPVARAVRESERLTIFDCVTPRSYAGAAEGCEPSPSS